MELAHNQKKSIARLTQSWPLLILILITINQSRFASVPPSHKEMKNNLTRNKSSVFKINSVLFKCSILPTKNIYIIILFGVYILQNLMFNASTILYTFQASSVS